MHWLAMVFIPTVTFWTLVCGWLGACDPDRG